MVLVEVMNLPQQQLVAMLWANAKHHRNIQRTCIVAVVAVVVVVEQDDVLR